MRKAVSQLVGGNVLSKLLGMGREVFVAALFGTGAIVGAFRIAQTCTLVPINFFTSDSLNSAFIPLYKRYLLESRAKADSLLWTVIALFSLFSLTIVTGLWLWAPVWVSLVAPGLDQSTAAIATSMLQIMGLGVPFYLLTALLNYLGMAHDDFVPMAARASVQSIGLVAGAVLAYLLDRPVWFAWGFSGCYMFFGLWSLRRAVKSGSMRKPAWDRGQTKEVLVAFWVALRPVILLPVMLQGNIMVERIVASRIGLTAISALDYARFITETLLYLVSIPVAFAGLTNWSGISDERLRSQLERIVALLLLVTIPISSFLTTHADLLVRLVYGRGAFDANSVKSTSDILFGTALGLWAQVIGYVLLKALSSQLRNRAVFFVMTSALVANISVNLSLYRYFGPVTLGLGNSIYGLALLAATLWALKLMPHFMRNGWILAVGVIGYMVMDATLPKPASVWFQACTEAFFAIFWWSALVLVVPTLRRLVASVGRTSGCWMSCAPFLNGF